MYITVEEYNSKIEEFNKKYGVEFSYEMINSYIGDSKSLERHNVYNTIGLKLAKEACQQHLISKIKKGEVGEFTDSILVDFEYLIMEPHVEKPTTINEYVLYNLDFSRDESKRYAFIKDSIKDAPKNIADVYQREYKNGKLPIRKMRQFVEGLNVDNLSEDQVLTALNYSRALNQAYKERSIFSIILHPIRSYAENKYVKKFTEEVYNMLKEKDSYTNTSFKKISEYIKIVKGTAKGLEDSIRSLDNKIKESRENENYGFFLNDEDEEEYKEINIKDIPKDKRLANKKLMEAGYVPDIKNINKEYKELSKIQKFINEDANLNNYPNKEYLKVLKQIINENIERCKVVSDVLNERGEDLAKREIDEKQREIWQYTTITNTNMLAFSKSYIEGDFIEPKIIIDKDEEEFSVQEEKINERVPINVDINENKIEGLSEIHSDKSIGENKDRTIGGKN